MKKNIIQGKLNQLDKKFQPKKGVRTIYVQPQRINGKDTCRQPKRTN